MLTPNRDATIGFIGASLVGASLAVALSRKGYKVIAVASRSEPSAESLASRIEGCRPYRTPQGVVDSANVVFVTVPDGSIGKVASSVSWQKGQSAIHCSGIMPASEMDHAVRSGAQVGSLHPLQTFSSLEGALESLEGSTFAIEADQPLRSFLEGVARDLGGRPIPLKAEDKALYHAAAVMACGHVVTLVSLAADLWGNLGYSRAEALEALLPLLRGAVGGMEAVGLPQALTGPIARGDVATIQMHLAALRHRAPHVLEPYRQVALSQIPIASAKSGLNRAATQRMQELLEDASTTGRGGR